MLPLIINTRPENIASETTADLIAAGFSVLEIPLTRIRPRELPEHFLGDNESKHRRVLIFTSANGVRSLQVELRGVRCIAVGDETGAELRARGAELIFVPKEQSSAGLIAELPSVLDLLSGGKIYLVQGSNASLALYDALISLCPRMAERVIAYDVEPLVPSVGDIEAVKEALADRAIVLFYSPQAVRIFSQYIDSRIVSGCLVIGSATKETALAAGFPVIGVPVKPSTAEIISILSQVDFDSRGVRT